LSSPGLASWATLGRPCGTLIGLFERPRTCVLGYSRSSLDGTCLGCLSGPGLASWATLGRPCGTWLGLFERPRTCVLNGTWGRSPRYGGVSRSFGSRRSNHHRGNAATVCDARPARTESLRGFVGKGDLTLWSVWNCPQRRCKLDRTDRISFMFRGDKGTA